MTLILIQHTHIHIHHFLFYTPIHIYNPLDLHMTFDETYLQMKDHGKIINKKKERRIFSLYKIKPIYI